MATLYGTQITNLDSNPQNKIDTPEWNGNVKAFYFDWTGDAAQNDLVEVLRLPTGAMVIAGRVDFTDFGTSVTMDIGTSADEDHWAAAIDVATAAGQSDFANTVALNGLMTERLSAETSVYLKFEAANPASGTVEGYMLVALPT